MHELKIAVGDDFYAVEIPYHSECADDISGADVIHPIQALATGMEPHGLKSQFGKKVSFAGGVDTQDLLDNGTEEEVRDKVKQLREIFPTGLIVSPSHEAIMSEVPPKNIEVLFDEATKVY